MLIVYGILIIIVNAIRWRAVIISNVLGDEVPRVTKKKKIIIIISVSI